MDWPPARLDMSILNEMKPLILGIDDCLSGFALYFSFLLPVLVATVVLILVSSSSSFMQNSPATL